MLTSFARGQAPSTTSFSLARACFSPVASIPRKTYRSCSRPGPRSQSNVAGSLILVGPGNDRQSLAELARSLGIADRVQFTGGVDNPAEYLRAADVFVLPSVAEGMSNSLLEAMATALPCAVSAIGGNTDLIEDGTTGRLVRQPNSTSLDANPPRAARRPGPSAAHRRSRPTTNRRRVRPERCRRSLC